MAPIERLDAAVTYCAHHLQDLTRLAGREQQMPMIAQQHTRHESPDSSEARLVEPVVGIDKDRAAIDTALSDVKQCAGELEAWAARHGMAAMLGRYKTMLPAARSRSEKRDRW